MNWRKISEHERPREECMTQRDRAVAMSADARLMGERAGKMIEAAFAACALVARRRAAPPA
jgi:hypothetical protein